MFQLHLPRYSSPEILRQRLQTAIQNSGRSTHHSGPLLVQQPIELASDQGDTTILMRIPVDPGHTETLGHFLVRCQIGAHHAQAIQSNLSVKDLEELLGATSTRQGRANFERCIVKALRAERYAPADKQAWLPLIERTPSSGSTRTHGTETEQSESAPAPAAPAQHSRPRIRERRLDPPQKIERFDQVGFQLYYDAFATAASTTAPSEATKSCALVRSLDHLFRFMKDDHYTNRGTRKDGASEARSSFGRHGGFDLLIPMLGSDASKVLYYTAAKQVAQCSIGCQPNKDRVREAGLLPLFKRFITAESVGFSTNEAEQSRAEEQDGVRPVKLMTETASAVANAGGSSLENRRLLGTLGFMPL
eukprot:COSAG03_NODE_6290_length_1083_cov_1.216463_1_plen_361_part_11